ncbi:hypothetical protein PGH42_13850 [Legionella pneumophila]|nr:hypothetical protein PGH42_13850 [Legionella pneumophila]
MFSLWGIREVSCGAIGDNRAVSLTCLEALDANRISHPLDLYDGLILYSSHYG